jgi:hypothetical protein
LIIKEEPVIKVQILHSYQNSTDNSNVIVSKKLSPKNVVGLAKVLQESSSEGLANEDS